jgi:hypothetical protein
MRPVKNIALALLLVFVMPALATAGWWGMQEHPDTWRNADWSSAGILPRAPTRDEAAIYVLAARTGGIKGAFALHSWLVVKKPGSDQYDRYDKVGWGSPIRHNGYAADGRWYSNAPEIVVAATGTDAVELIPAVEAAIADYRFSKSGDYRVWPGPNSNSFVAHVLRGVPDLGMTLPANATGRDYAPGVFAVDLAPDWRDLHVTFGGLFGFAVGMRSGIEIHFAGLVAGVDILRPALKIPAYGTVSLI